MRRTLAMTSVVAALAAALPPVAQVADPQTVVDGALLTVIDLRKDQMLGKTARDLLRRAYAVVIVPRLIRAGFILAGEGGTGVLLVRDGEGSWSYPAFYGISGGSVGLQAGGEISEVMLLIMNKHALSAVMHDKFEIGARANITVVELSAEVESSTTTNAGADVYAVARGSGFFGGVALQGAVILASAKQDRDYYEKDVSVEDILFGHAALNRFADSLRSTLAEP